MSTVLLMNVLDIARSLGRTPHLATPEQVAQFIQKEFARKGGAFNYNTAIKLLPNLFSGAMNVDQAIVHCKENGAPAGRKHIAEAIALAGSYAASNPSRCYQIPFTAVPIGRLTANRTAYMGLKAPMVRVSEKGVFVVVPGFRMSHRPVDQEIDLAASLVLATLARDDFGGADYEYLYAGPGEFGGRVLAAYHGRDRKVHSLEEIEFLLDKFLKGLQIALDAGAPGHRPNFHGYKVIDPAQASMF